MRVDTFKRAARHGAARASSRGRAGSLPGAGTRVAARGTAAGVARGGAGRAGGRAWRGRGRGVARGGRAWRGAGGRGAARARAAARTRPTRAAAGGGTHKRGPRVESIVLHSRAAARPAARHTLRCVPACCREPGSSSKKAERKPAKTARHSKKAASDSLLQNTAFLSAFEPPAGQQGNPLTLPAPAARTDRSSWCRR